MWNKEGLVAMTLGYVFHTWKGYPFRMQIAAQMATKQNHSSCPSKWNIILMLAMYAE